MTDLEIAEAIKRIIESSKHDIEDGVLAIIQFQSSIVPIKKAQATQYLSKKTGAIFVEIPRLSRDDGIATAQLALAVGRRLERFERGAKANATRTPNSRKKIAQNAIQARWSA